MADPRTWYLTAELDGGGGQIPGHLKRKWHQVSLRSWGITCPGSQKCVSRITCTVIISDVVLYSLQTMATHTYFVSSATIRIFLNKGEINLEMVLNWT